MAVTLQNIAPEKIEAESFRIIADELGNHSFDEQSFAIIQRVIHATGDFTFAENMIISPEAIDKAIGYLKAGKTILTDVNMVAMGISKPLLKKWGCDVVCKIADQDVAERAKKNTTTRAEAAMELGLQADVGIVAIGNAPTALLKILDSMQKVPGENQPVIIGVPVGFVNAAESKQLLSQTTLPFITSLGRKGGSPVAAAIVNALIRLAQK